jgi:hypothetical protein
MSEFYNRLRRAQQDAAAASAAEQRAREESEQQRIAAQQAAAENAARRTEEKEEIVDALELRELLSDFQRATSRDGSIEDISKTIEVSFPPSPSSPEDDTTIQDVDLCGVALVHKEGSGLFGRDKVYTIVYVGFAGEDIIAGLASSGLVGASSQDSLNHALGDCIISGHNMDDDEVLTLDDEDEIEETRERIKEYLTELAT